MGSETNSPSSSGKRNRDPEDEVYIDNLHSHKRYLSEIMASSLNGLTVGDPIAETIMDSPARSENNYYMRDDNSLQYSPMSEDLSDDPIRFCEIPTSSVSHPESLPTSPVSPYRYKSLNAFCSSPSPPTSTCQPSTSNNFSALPSSTPSSSQSRQRGSSSDTEGRFPSSPSDICHSADLRRAALLRSVQMRTQPPGTMGPISHQTPYDLGYSSLGHEIVQNGENREGDEPSPPCTYMKSLVDNERDYSIENDGCSSMGVTEPDFDDQEKSREVLDVGKAELTGD